MPTNLTLAAVGFVLIHRLIAGSSLRSRIVRRIGERSFQIAFSILSVVMTAWLVTSYLMVAPATIDPQAYGTAIIVKLAGAISLYLIVAGLTTRNPTIVGMAETARRHDAVHGVIRLTRHPFMVGVALLSITHLLVSHTVADWLFFGTLAFVAFSGIQSIDAKRARTLGADWDSFRQATSAVPGIAVLDGRQPLRLREIGLIRPIVAALLFAVSEVMHTL